MTRLFPRPIAHRGLHDRARGIVENSASAFEAAIAAGFDIECDLQLSRDGAPIVFHDDDLSRLTGRHGPVAGLSAGELTAIPLLDSAAADRPQRFEAMLEQVAGRALLQVELKRQPTAEANGKLARAAAAAVSGYRGPLVFMSFDPGLVSAVRAAGFRGRVGIITYAYDQPGWEGALTAQQKFVLRHLLHWPSSRFDFISCHQHALMLPAVRLFRATGMPVTSWTIRTQAENKAVKGKADQIVFEGFNPFAPLPPA